VVGGGGVVAGGTVVVPVVPAPPLVSTAPLPVLLPLVPVAPAAPVVPDASSLDRPLLPAAPELPWLVVDFDFLVVLFFALGVALVGELASFRVLSEAVVLVLSWPLAWAPPARARATEAPMMLLSR
jgi:hypothetical protein